MPFAAVLFSYSLVVFLAFTPRAWSSQGPHPEEGDDRPTFVPNTIAHVKPVPIEQAPAIDGVMEAVWRNTPRLDNFAEIWPAENVPSKARTEAYVTFDTDHLYFLFVCYDEDLTKLRATMTDRDRIFRDDFVGIQLDTYGNEQAAYELFVNPFGIQGDLIRRIDGDEDASFDAVWESGARVYDDHWVAEMKIPFKSLRYPGTSQQDWRLHVLRIYPRESRYVLSWMPVSSNNNAYFSQAGHLVLSDQISRNTNLELLPYVIGSGIRTTEEKDNGDGRHVPASWDGNAGFNVKYGLSSNMTIDLAYNPDFSQIESDAGQISVNNTLALYYPEKRPFFLEGGDIFRVDNSLNLLYTRSINDPLAAAKVTGKVGKATIGLISAYDESTPYILPFEDGSSEFRTGRNSTSHIARIKYDLGSRSYVGVAASDRRLSGGASNTAVAADANIRLNEIYSISGILGVSRTKELSDSTVSADEIDEGTFRANGHAYTNALDGESFTGTAFRANFRRDAKHWNVSAVYEDISPGLRAENSFIRSNNYRNANVWTGYTFRPEKHPALNRIEPQVFVWRKYNYDGTLKDWGMTPALWINFQKQTSLYISGFVINNENFHGRQFNRMHRAWITLNSNAFKTVSGGFWIEAGKSINRFGDETDPVNPLAIVKSLNIEMWITLKPVSRLTDDISYLSSGLWRHFGGPLIRQQHIFRHSVAYQFTRRLFFRLITEANFTEKYYTDTDGPAPVTAHDKSTSFQIEPLFSYKVNPFTVFFVGGSFGGSKDPYPNFDGYNVTDQNIFVKFQYFVRI